MTKVKISRKRKPTIRVTRKPTRTIKIKKRMLRRDNGPSKIV